MKNISNNFISLAKGFQSLKLKSHNTASAVFPLIISKTNDLIIVFFNYWLNKNKIKCDKIKFFARLYDQNGNQVGHFEQSISEHHNEISLREFLEKMQINSLIGSVNIEIVSLEKLSFPFPAILGIYKSNNLFSSVHSAGRIKNNSEIQTQSYTQETNWICKFEKNISPFFHYFVGNNKPNRKYILVRLISKSNKVKKIKKIFINNINPFGSKIFLINEIFKKTKFEKDDFVSVEVEHNSVFPRMVVGNYHKKLNFYEVTHSFPKILKKDYCPKKKEIKYQSKMTGCKNKDLDLSLEVFPTNCEGEFKADFFKKNFNEKIQSVYKKDVKFSKKKLNEKLLFKFSEHEELKTIKMKGTKIPSRLNTSFIYKVKNSKNNFTADIADGARSSVFPPKYNHWGHGYLGDNFNSILTIVNDNYDDKNFNKNLQEGVLIIYFKNIKISKKIKINSNSSTIVDISKIESIEKLKKEDKNFFSWILKLKKPGCECFWVSYRKKDGAIFGDHSF